MMSLFKSWRQDLPASIVVALVALPLCLGIALASGAPLFSGLIAGIVGGLIVGALSKSSLSVAGPAAGLTVIVLGAIESLPSYQAFLLAVVLAGAMQVAFAALPYTAGMKVDPQCTPISRYTAPDCEQSALSKRLTRGAE